MKFALFVLATVLAVALARPQQNPDKAAETLRLENDNSGLGQYRYALETSNGIKIEEAGQTKDLGPEDKPIVSQGSFEWTAPDGQRYQVSWIADENGFQPSGAHLPVAP